MCFNEVDSLLGAKYNIVTYNFILSLYNYTKCQRLNAAFSENILQHVNVCDLIKFL